MSHRIIEKHYSTALNKMVDSLFEEASNRQLTWSKMAKDSGLCYATVMKLGTRKTKLPQFRTVQLLAASLGGKVEFTKGAIRSPRKGVRLKIWRMKKSKVA